MLNEIYQVKSKNTRVNKFIKGARYKTNIQKSFAFSDSNNDQKFKLKITLVITVSSNIKYLVIHLTKYVQICTQKL